MNEKPPAVPRHPPERQKEQLQALRDEFYAALVVMRNYYAQAISRAAVDEVLERGWKFIKQTDEVLAVPSSAVAPIRAHVEGCPKALRVPVDLCECGGRDFRPSPTVAVTSSQELIAQWRAAKGSERWIAAHRKCADELEAAALAPSADLRAALQAICNDAAGALLEGDYAGCVAVDDSLIAKALDVLAALDHGDAREEQP